MGIKMLRSKIQRAVHTRGSRQAILLVVIAFTLSSYRMISKMTLVQEFDNAQVVSLGKMVFNLMPHEPQSRAALMAAEKTIIAYAVTITGCAPMNKDDSFPIAEAAAVLKYSIARATSNGRYGYKLYAIYHPQAEECAKTLGPLGYTLLKRDTPVAVEEIQGSYLRSEITKSGCCGERELIKFEAYTLTEHQAVILLDLDSLVLKPLDEIFDLLLYRKLPDSENKRNLLMWPDRELPQDIRILHTIDYAMAFPEDVVKPFQGGFAVIRPNLTVYEEFRSIVRQGDFHRDTGWGHVTNIFWGVHTFQGLMPYYHHVLHPGYSVELNWCTYNNMCSPSRDRGLENDIPVGKCFTNESTCEDCRTRKLEEIALFHFTVCYKPWLCYAHNETTLDHELCRTLHHEWFRTRSEMEISWGRSGWGEGDYYRDLFFGYCSEYGTRGYSLINPVLNDTLTDQQPSERKQVASEQKVE